MKRNISDLLDQYPAEDMELGGNTPYSATRIKEITMNNIREIENMEPKTKRNAKRFKPARLLIAAAVVAALSVSALAAGRVFGAGELFQDFFTKEDGALSQGQLDAIDQLGHVAGEAAAQLPAAVTDNGTTITPVAAIADENVFYVRLRIEAPEGTALPDLGETGYYQLGCSLESKQDGLTALGDAVTVLPDEEPNDNRKEFVLFFGNPETDGVSGDNIQFNDGNTRILTITGLWIQPADKNGFENYIPLFTGNFVFDFTLSFQSQTIELDAAGLTWHHELLNYTNTLKSMSLSPLSLSLCIDSTMPVNDWIGTYMGDVQIVLKDGTVFFSEIENYDALDRYIQSNPAVTLPMTGQPVGVFTNYVIFDEPLDLSQVDYVQYGDNKIPVNVE